MALYNGNWSQYFKFIITKLRDQWLMTFTLIVFWNTRFPSLGCVNIKQVNKNGEFIGVFLHILQSIDLESNETFLEWTIKSSNSNTQQWAHVTKITTQFLSLRYCMVSYA